MDPQLRRDPKYQNFVTVFRGYAYVGKALEPYTVSGLQRAYQKAYRACAGLPPCLQQCSRIHGRNTIMWCGTCTTWKNALLQERRRPFNSWENTGSWNWSTSYDNIASVFLPSFWNPNDIKFNEFGTACHLWTSCKEFNIGNALLKKLRELRNKHYGHNPDLKIKNVEKTKVFDALKTLVRGQDVQAYVNVGQCIQDLDNIAKGDELTAFMDDIEERLDNLCLKMDTNDATQKIFAVCVEVCISKIVREIKIQNQTLGAIRNRLGNDNGSRLLKTSVCLLVLAFLVYAVPMFVKRRANEGSAVFQQYTECFSETYSYPFPQDLRLLPYFKEHSTFFGRDWLFEDIEKYIEAEGFSEKGVLITAAMGYGKSAIIKHLLCSDKNTKAYRIRSHIAAFHLCRFDVPSSKNPQRFIYRLVGFLSTHLPEYGALISLLPESALLFDDEKCRREIVACFDQSIWDPLGEMKTIDSGIKIIVVDALDECYDMRSGVNELYNLLQARYRHLPKWIKLIITSRNTSFIHKMHHLKHFSLDSSDHRNRKDIMLYVEYKASLYPTINNFEGGLGKVLDQSEGLFLFVVHLLEYLTTNEKGVDFKFPDTLSDVYEMNFERHFHSIADYEIVRPILEIVIASLHPLSHIDVFNILENLNVSRKDTAGKMFEKIAFCFRSSQELTFIHQTLQLWLISSEDSKMFHVSAERGHAMLSRYLLHQINNSRADIVDIAIHIGNSNDTTLEKAFSGTFSNNDVTKSTLHKLVWKSDSTRALKLILNMQVDVETLNEGYVTPAFVAAARGHLGQLKLLQSRGADLNFKVNDTFFLTSSSQIDMIKQEFYLGYRLIHIAAKYGHSETVGFLLRQNKTLLFVANGLGLTVADIVCENGHEKLLRLISKFKADVGHCLYYAAKNKHIHIVNVLIRMGLNASCISHSDAINAYAKSKVIDMTKSLLISDPGNKHLQLLNLNVLWWVVNQESPLHAAIKAKSEETAIALIKHYPHLADCVDAFGMTPFLLCVTENLTNVFQLLVERVTIDTCGNPSTLHQPQPYSRAQICPVGGSYAHLDGIYGRFDLTKIIYQRGIVIDWLAPDSNSISAAHYSACNGNMLFLNFLRLIVEVSWLDIRSENRSTPYHSAAICGSPGAFVAMTDSFTNPPPELYDIENKTLLHYIVMREFTGNPAHVDIHTQAESLFMFRKLQESGLNVGISDSLMRNILHYALRNGHFDIVRHLFFGASFTLKELLKQRDIYGYSPVVYAIRSRKVSLYVAIQMMITSKCAFYDLFLTSCVPADKYTQYLSSWELALVTVLQAAPEEIKADISIVFKDILMKSPYLTIASLVYLKGELDLGHLREHFIESMVSMNDNLYVSVYAVARHCPMLFTVCGSSFLKSPLHQIAYNYTSGFIIGESRFLHLAFGYPINKHALNCADSRGYNSLHYALMGGNIGTAIRLFDIGVSITNKKVSIKDVPWMMLFAKKKQVIHIGFDYADHFNRMDNLLQKILIKFPNKLFVTDVCLKTSHGLSLVHVLAVTGLKYSMKVLFERFSKETIVCRNKDNITSMYLWDLFNNQSFEDIVELPALQLPRQETEYVLLLGLWNDFPWDMFVTGPFRCILNEKHLKLNMIKCFTNFQIGFRNIDHQLSPFYRKNGIILNCLINGSLHALNNLEDAIYFKRGNINNALLEVKVFAESFQLTFRLLNLRYNYPRLKHLIIDTFNASVCEQVSIHLHCVQLYKEFDHMLKRVKAYYIRELIYEYISSQQPYNFQINGGLNLLKQRMETLIKRSLTLFHSPTLPFDREKFTYSNVHERVLLEHSYLNILRKTAKYQYMKRHMQVPLVEPFHYKHKDEHIHLKSEIPKPFHDIIKYVNASSYGHIFESIH